MKQDHLIVGVHVQDRVNQAGPLQDIFTRFGCNIKTRLGLHEVHDNFCAATGIIVLEMVGEEREIDGMISELGALDGVEARKMVFAHD